MIAQDMLELGSHRSCIRELFDYGLARAREIGAENVFDYSLGNPSVPAPEAVNDAIRTTLATQSSLAVHGYTPALGAAEARAAIAEDLNRRFGANLRAENFLLTCGAAPALCAVLRALAVEGSEFLLLAPYFPEYAVFVAAAGGRSVIVPADETSFHLALDAIEMRLSPHTQALIVNSPNNPSGVIYTREELTALAALLRRKSAEYGHPIYLLSDEPYRELVYDGAEIPFLPSLYEHTVLCYSFSKSLSLPGERIGYLCVPDAAAESEALLLAAAGAARAAGHVCAPSLMQRVVALCAAERPDLRPYAQNRDTLYHALTEMGFRCVLPDGAFYMLLAAPDGDGDALSLRARAHDLLIVPARDFGVPAFCRLSICVSGETVRRSLPAFRALRAEYPL